MDEDERRILERLHAMLKRRERCNKGLFSRTWTGRLISGKSLQRFAAKLIADGLAIEALVDLLLERKGYK